ncbi:MAG: hypothetical protein ACOYXC_00145 [Candidatus Rifleibacteriota bacterium]
MTSLNSFKKLGLICLALILLAAPRGFSQEDLDEFGGLDDLGGDSTVTESPADPAAGGDGAIAEDPAAMSGDSGGDLGGDSAGGDPAGGDSSGMDSPKMSESEQVEAIANKFTFAAENPKKDPFRPLVEKKVILPPVRTVKPVSNPEDNKPKPPPIKPIKLHVSGIVGNDSNRLAVVKFENEEYTLTKDMVVDGKFKVVDILADRVVVYSNKEQRRHTFKIESEGDEPKN